VPQQPQTIGIALHKYHETAKKVPPSVITRAGGTTLNDTDDWGPQTGDSHPAQHGAGQRLQFRMPRHLELQERRQPHVTGLRAVQIKTFKCPVDEHTTSCFTGGNRETGGRGATRAIAARDVSGSYFGGAYQNEASACRAGRRDVRQFPVSRCKP